MKKSREWFAVEFSYFKINYFLHEKITDRFPVSIWPGKFHVNLSYLRMSRSEETSMLLHERWNTFFASRFTSRLKHDDSQFASARMLRVQIDWTLLYYLTVHVTGLFFFDSYSRSLCFRFHRPALLFVQRFRLFYLLRSVNVRILFSPSWSVRVVGVIWYDSLIF